MPQPMRVLQAFRIPKAFPVSSNSTSYCLRHHSRPAITSKVSTQKFSTTSITYATLQNQKKMKERLVIIGSGWAGTTLASEINEQKYSVSLISPETSLSYTPLLASAACGLYDFNLVQQPIRHASKHTKIVKAVVQGIDFKGKKIKCEGAFGDREEKEKFEMGYDVVVLAPGVSSS